MEGTCAKKKIGREGQCWLGKATIANLLCQKSTKHESMSVRLRREVGINTLLAPFCFTFFTPTVLWALPKASGWSNMECSASVAFAFFKTHQRIRVSSPFSETLR
jgi:hypothetical protein